MEAGDQAGVEVVKEKGRNGLWVYRCIIFLIKEFIKKASEMGVEPTTSGFVGRCSTIELLRHPIYIGSYENIPLLALLLTSFHLNNF